MAHPIFEELNRIYTPSQMQTTFFRRLQRVTLHEIQPLLDEREALLVEHARLTEENAAMRAAIANAPTKEDLISVEAGIAQVAAEYAERMKPRKVQK